MVTVTSQTTNGAQALSITPPGGWGPAGREKQQRDSVLPGISDWGPEGWNYSQMHFSPLLTFFFIT